MGPLARKSQFPKVYVYFFFKISELPKSLVIQIADSLHPLDLEKCENTQLFKRLGKISALIFPSFYKQGAKSVVCVDS